MQKNIVEKLENLKKKGLVDSAFNNIKKWLENEEYKDFFQEIEELIVKGNIDELNESFYQVMPFGTGGRRGKMGPGPNRINTRMIAESAQGFADYLVEHFGEEEVKDRGMVVTYDIRHNSEKFAKVAAGVFAANGLKVYFYDGVRSTPQLSFSIRYKKAIGGAMISASHNPPSDNGIKIFWETGGQVVPPHDVNIIEKAEKVKEVDSIAFDEALKEGLIEMMEEDIDLAYHKVVGDLSLGNYRDLDIVFTPLHGCASTSFLPVLRHVGYKNIYEVKEQMSIDPDFSQVPNQIPNPEVPASLELATEYAKKRKSDIVLSADPDADRIGVVSRESFGNNNYVFLNGNQIGVLIFDYIVRKLKERGDDLSKKIFIKTAVTTDLLLEIANDNNIDSIPDVPVGFKYIADIMDNRLGEKEFIFGAEESHGYLYGEYARDKDGAISALLICEYAALLKKENRTLFEHLEHIKKEYGYYRELLQSMYFYGMDGMEKMLKIMDFLRKDLPKKICGLKVECVMDQFSKKMINPENGKIIGEYIGFPDNALAFYLGENKKSRIIVRPSGTEPKIKFYAAAGKNVGLDKSWEEYVEIKKECDDLVAKILEEVVSLAESISPGGERFEVLG